MKEWDKVFRRAQGKQGPTLCETGSWRQCLRRHEAPVHIVYWQPVVQKAHVEKFLLLQLPWLQKVLPSFPYIFSFTEMKKLLSVEKTDANCTFKAGVRCFFRHAARIVKLILASTDANKHLIQFQKQSHPSIGDSILLKIRCWIQIQIAQNFYCPD